MSTNTLTLEKRDRPKQTQEQQRQRYPQEYSRQKTKRIVVTDANYYALMAKGRFGQTFNDVIAELLDPGTKKRTSRYGSDNPNSKH